MSPKRRTPKPRKRGDAGVLPSNFAKPIRWKVDADYNDALSPADRQWLAHFNDCYYGGDFRGADESEWPTELRRAIWTDVRAARVDAHTLAGLGGALSLFSETGPNATEPGGGSQPTQGTDWAATPDYLNDPDYKAARAAFRDQLRQGRQHREPEPSPELDRAARRLQTLTPPADASQVRPTQPAATELAAAPTPDHPDYQLAEYDIGQTQPQRPNPPTTGPRRANKRRPRRQ